MIPLTNTNIWQQPIPTSAKLILLYLKSIADENGESRPQIISIGQYCDLSSLIVKKHINTLIDKKLITRKLVPGYESIFKILIK